jgi:RNA polymerase sigma-70 factor (ECF subfamily)
VGEGGSTARPLRGWRAPADLNECAMLAPVEEQMADRRAPATADAELILAVGRGDRGEPLHELYRRYSGRVFGLGVQLLGDRGLAEELVQETFVRLWRNAERFDPERGSAATFVFTMARRLAIDLWRRPSSRPAKPQPAPDPGEDQVERLLVGLQVRDALDSLSESHRRVLELSYRDQLKQTEIAERLGVPLGTVKTRSYHALRSLRAALEQRGIHG